MMLLNYLKNQIKMWNVHQYQLLTSAYFRMNLTICLQLRVYPAILRPNANFAIVKFSSAQKSILRSKHLSLIISCSNFVIVGLAWPENRSVLIVVCSQNGQFQDQTASGIPRTRCSINIFQCSNHKVCPTTLIKIIDLAIQLPIN